MRLRYTAVNLFCALSCAEQLDLQPHLQARQGDVATTTGNAATTTRDQSTRTSTPTTTESATKTNDVESTTTPSQTDGDGDVTSAITAVPLPTGTATNGSNATIPDASELDPNQLPIEPVITPALGVAGALLMISGLALAFVGIKHRPTQTFLSTSLLIALSIEVLIIYLMRPPISNAIQGAYLIAGALGGWALGALALIFPEVSEGFGCLLGGFCLAMWLLVLSPGGVVQNKVGKIIMIGLFCAGASSLYISRFTRVYGLIGCTAFAGATAFIIGLDCFSKAGLKEFWMYIWDINSDAFPLFTDTYPINRDMRAEIAAIIIITFFGVLSQIKIWRIVKEQKAKREADRLAEQEARDAEEAEVGRDIEAQVARERGDWEGTYEGKKTAGVRVDSVSESDKGSNVDSYDMSSPRTSEKRRSFPMLSLQPATRDGSDLRSPRSNMSSGSLNLPENSNTRASTAPSLPPLSFDFESGTQNPRSPSIVTSGTATPGLGISHAGSNASSTADVSLSERRNVETKRLSMASLSVHHAMQDVQSPFEDEEDDVASSIAATAAEAPDLDALSMRLSRPASMYYANASPMQTQEAFILEDDDEALCLSPNGGKSPGGASKAGSSPEIPAPPRTEDGSYFSGATAEAASAQAVLKERLPKKMSKAASTYRTNEWAKEVSRAEPVPVEEVEEHTKDAVQVETTDAAKAARAEENNATPAPPAPPPAALTPAPMVRPVSKVENIDRSSKRRSRMPSGNAATPVYAHSSAGSEDSWSVPLAKRVSSNPALSTYPIAEEGTRNFSSPNTLTQQSKSSAPRTSLQPRSQSKDRLSQMPRSMSSMSNLLDARQDRLDVRLTTTSFMTPNAEAPPTTVASPSDSMTRGDDSQGNPSSNTSISDAAGHASQEEEMTLAERKAIVQRRSTLPQQNTALVDRQQNRRFSSRNEIPDPYRTSLVSPTKQIRMSNPIYDSHQPRRASGHNVVKQAMNWNQWRDSNAQVGQQRGPIVTSDNQMDMLRAARVQAEAEAKRREQHQKQMQEQMDQHMRMGGMHDAHRAALSRMQSKVKD